MPKVPHEARVRDDRSGRWAVTRPSHALQRHPPRHTTFLVVAGVLGLILGVGLGPMAGALVDASHSTPPTEPGAFLTTAAIRLREFQYQVRDLRMQDLFGTLTAVFVTQDQRR